MKCEKCGNGVEKAEITVHQGQEICEDCLMEALSPLKPCDPWAVHSARSMGSEDVILTRKQRQVLGTVKEKGAIPPDELASLVGLSSAELQREIATLRHMEKVRMAMKNDTKVVCVWR